MSGELVYRVNGTSAVTMKTSTLEAAGLKERQHLQEWVLANPEILGEDVLIVTSEFDQWFSKDGRDPDRLDVLGLGQDGRLVVAELKRDMTPDLVTMQAINYASRASRFTPDMLADAFFSFHRGRTDAVGTSDQALSRLLVHAPTLSADTLRNPRIVIVAGDFTPKVTSAAVWLSERGIDISLARVRAYSMDDGHVVTVSQVWPVPQAEDFVVSPSRVATATASSTLPEEPWSRDDLESLLSLPPSLTVLTLMDLCSTKAGDWVGGDDVYAASGRSPGSHRGELAGFGNTIKSRFGRSNPPWAMEYAKGDTSQQYYSVTAEIAQIWAGLRSVARPVSEDAHDDHS